MGYLTPYDKTDKYSILNYAKGLIGETFEDVIKYSAHTLRENDELSMSNRARKGGLGNLLERYYFGYEPNSNPEPDFPEAGVELKVTPFEYKRDGAMKAAERLVLTMIDYAGPAEPDFYKSHLWYKCKLLLLIFYLRDRSLPKNLLYKIYFTILFTPNEVDLEIIKNDYEKIIGKIIAGKAHELSESDTMYLGACTKGQTAATSLSPQYYGDHRPAKRRAFCYKQPYMTYVLNHYVVPDENECIITDASELKEKSFEEIIISRIMRYKGKTEHNLMSLFDVPEGKSKMSLIAFRMLGVKSNHAEEFEKANIVVKTIRIEENGTIREDMSFPAMDFQQILDEKEWEDSWLYNYFSQTKFLFVVYRSINHQYTLDDSKLWNMPEQDLNGELKRCWTETKAVLENGVKLEVKRNKNGIVVSNNFPKKADNMVSHVRPHTSLTFYDLGNGEVFGKGTRANASQLPDGRWMTKQSFWLDKRYILKQLQK